MISTHRDQSEKKEVYWEMILQLKYFLKLIIEKIWRLNRETHMKVEQALKYHSSVNLRKMEKIVQLCPN